MPPRRVEIPAPDLEPWLPGNVGIPGVWSFAAEAPGPHVALVALVHGNEIAGARLLVRLLEIGLRPRAGRLSLIFANLEAFARFDPANPTASRYVDEDMNRVWSEEALAGPISTAERRRARALRPLIDTVDVLLDLHSMLWEGEPLLIAGPVAKARRFAVSVGAPPLVVGDEGHVGGRRLIDYGPFADPATARVAILVEAGQHWVAETERVMALTAARLLTRLGVIGRDLAQRLAPALDDAAVPAVRYAEVTRTVTARTSDFAFVQPFRGGEIIAARNTLIALDGAEEIRTPHDDCLLVMPSLRTCRGHTAVRLARLAVPPGG
ncbi:MAG: succinylglutamate desuccinylase/aspartoacylase family protein [Acetobacteraceae bacterium]|nr:succinylglutamate desuccinylase/aspartoacylase family protein [Acetobacteraceae bacterium]